MTEKPDFKLNIVTDEKGRLKSVNHIDKYNNNINLSQSPNDPEVFIQTKYTITDNALDLLRQNYDTKTTKKEYAINYAESMSSNPKTNFSGLT
jgi:hypothetical protein